MNDGTDDGTGVPQTGIQDIFGIDIDESTGQFFGVPRASSVAAGTVDLTIRVFADVMNPVQEPLNPQFIPTGGDGEFDGTHPLTGLNGRHKTIAVVFDAPTAPMVGTANLPPGVDGLPYPGAQVDGTNGVPLLVPYTVGFTGTYPQGSNIKRNYDWDVSYVQDSSPGLTEGFSTLPADNLLPNSLSFVDDVSIVTNGTISGTTYDRGFHPVTFSGMDFYAGDATAPSPTLSQQPFSAVLTLSVSPDTAIYLRGVQTAEGAGTPSGLLDASTQINEIRMVPMFLAAGLLITIAGCASGSPSRRRATSCRSSCPTAAATRTTASPSLLSPATGRRSRTGRRTGSTAGRARGSTCSRSSRGSLCPIRRTGCSCGRRPRRRSGAPRPRAASPSATSR